MHPNRQQQDQRLKNGEVPVVKRRAGVWFGALGAILLSATGQPGLAGQGGGERTVEITASRYKYEPAQIEVAQGDQVRLVLHSADTTHGFAISALKVKVEIPKGGSSVSLSFLASRVGRFPIECSEYCGTGHQRMRGELVVTARTQ